MFRMVAIWEILAAFMVEMMCALSLSFFVKNMFAMLNIMSDVFDPYPCSPRMPARQIFKANL